MIQNREILYLRRWDIIRSIGCVSGKTGEDQFLNYAASDFFFFFSAAAAKTSDALNVPSIA